MAPLSYQVLHADPNTAARVGRLALPHGELETPTFMAVGTAGSVKALTMEQVRTTGADIVLGNTYHLHLRPGEELIQAAGGLHKFTGWSGNMLTDSGGYQVFSLAKLNDIDEDGVGFRSHIDGRKLRLDAESSIRIQNALGADIIMAFDQCPPCPAPRELVEKAVDRSIRWARRSLDAHARPEEQALFGIVQGGLHLDLRERCTAALRELDLPGYAVGGLSVGEGAEDMDRALAGSVGFLPEDRPRYLMGVGPPRDIVRAVGHGIDMFDCVLPTRNARNACLYTWSDGILKMRNAQHRKDLAPLDPDCPCHACSRGLSRAYLAHLCRAKEITYAVLGTLHNLTFFSQLMERIREHIRAGTFAEFRSAIERQFP